MHVGLATNTVSTSIYTTFTLSKNKYSVTDRDTACIYIWGSIHSNYIYIYILLLYLLEGTSFTALVTSWNTAATTDRCVFAAPAAAAAVDKCIYNMTAYAAVPT